MENLQLSQHFAFQVDSWVFEQTRYWIQQLGKGDCARKAFSHGHQCSEIEGVNFDWYHLLTYF